jgi:Mce-associated membrane protein
VPPSRRRPHPSAGQAPPVRRPRVAGLRNRPAAPEDAHEDAPERESMSGTLNVEDTEPESALDLDGDIDDDLDEDTDDDIDDQDEDQLDLDTDEIATEAVEAEAGEEAEPAPTPSRRPAGKRRTAGVTRPADLAAAEAKTGRGAAARPARPELDPRRRAGRQLSVAVVLTVLAIVLAGLAVWFRGEASDLDSADHNTALTDSGTTSEVVGQLKSAIEQTFSYNYTDLDSTQKAVDDTLTDKARCEYDQLFGQVKQLAPKQKIVMVTAVRDISLIRLDGDRAEALVFIDQNSTRVDVNNSVQGEAQFAVHAQRQGDHWKITAFDMFDQPLLNGKPAPKC